MKWLSYNHNGMRLGFLGFCLLGIMILNIVEVELSGFLFVMTFILSLLYFGGRWLVQRIKKTKTSERYQYRESVALVSVIVLLNVMAAAESYPQQLPLTIVFGELMIFSLLSLYWVYKRRRKTDRIYVLGLSGISLLATAVLVFSVTTLVLADSPGDYDSVAGLVFLVLFGVLCTAGIRWLVGQIKLVMRLKNEQTQSEIKHLQNQVNPHFFFNILNNLYGVVGQDTQKAQQLILKLSDLMRYSIYDGQKEAVSLREEVAYLENYIALQQLRYQKEIEVVFTKQIDDEEYRILPLLFIILLENAFKHGVEQLRKNAFVHLSLTAVAGNIDFQIKNNYDADDPREPAGLGLANLRRRLRLAYPQQHEIRVHDTGEVYEVALSLRDL